ncbi:unnamed protein product [Malus baccata var. baccata]
MFLTELIRIFYTQFEKNLTFSKNNECMLLSTYFLKLNKKLNRRLISLFHLLGCRKTSQSWKVISTKIEDGQAWRKYGQKIILKASYPRAYFRCTRKYDQGCKATKQVQQIQDNPRTYQTTYIGEHTCRTMIKASPMIIGPDLWPSQTVSSESGSPHRQNPNFFGSSSSSIPIVKQEDSKVGTPSDVTDNNVWLGLKDHLDFSEPTGICVSSNENVVSNMQWDDMVKSINFECDINFDEGFDAV